MLVSRVQSEKFKKPKEEHFSFFLSRLNKFDEYKVSSQATAWIKK